MPPLMGIPLAPLAAELVEQEKGLNPEVIEQKAVTTQQRE